MPDTSPSTPSVAAFDLNTVVLKSGAHAKPEDGMCVMEVVSFVAGERFSDHPVCASRVISAFLRSWNDALNDDDRQMLTPLIPLVINTAASPEVELRRSWMALDWYCRVSAPAWLRLAGLKVEADAIEATAPIVDRASAKAAQAVLDVARGKAYAAGDAARDAARDAAWAAACPTVVMLQASAIELVHRMIAAGAEAAS